MSKAIIDEQYLTDIADAIRAKNGSADTYTPSEMATAIDNLPSGLPIFEYYEITADTAMTNGQQTLDWTNALIQQYGVNPPYQYAMMFYVGTNPVNRQYLGGMKYSTEGPITSTNAQARPYRWANGIYTTQWSGGYDQNVNIGDIPDNVPLIRCTCFKFLTFLTS